MDMSIRFPGLNLVLDYVPRSFEIFGFEITIYGVLIAIGMLLGIFFVVLEARRNHEDPDAYLDLAIITLLSGVAGARLLYAAFSWSLYKNDPGQLLNIRSGGLMFYGGLLGFVLVVLLGCPVLEGMLFAVTMGYGLMMVWDVVLLYRYFPQSEESPWAFLRWVDAFLPLAFTGLCTNIGLFAHLVICWAGPSGVQVKGLFYGAPYYDVPALIAFLTILVTSVNFVVSVEVNFYPKYRNYYSLFNDGGVVGDIVTAEEEMLAVLNRELRFTALKQLFVTAAVLSLENTLLALLPLGFNDLMHGYFRTLCVGYGLYAVGNTILMILLYFTDYGGAVAAAAVFAVSASGLTALSMALDPAFYGFGFLIGAALFYLVTLFRLDVFTANLPYRVLGQQPIVAETKAGRFTRLGLFLEHKKRKPTKSAKHSAS